MDVAETSDRYFFQFGTIVKIHKMILYYGKVIYLGAVDYSPPLMQRPRPYELMADIKVKPYPEQDP